MAESSDTDDGFTDLNSQTVSTLAPEGHDSEQELELAESEVEELEATTSLASAAPTPHQTMQQMQHVPWDPHSAPDWDKERPSQTCVHRVTRDIMAVYAEPAPGICILPEKDDITKMHALITGPFDTPYEGGIFHFAIRCPPDYPLHPPRVKLLTTGGNRVRFNPNLYKSGKVCLSILGTWSGPTWSPAQTISSVLISIQSLLNEKPYHNEPGFERERTPGDCERYNEIIRHETLRVAVCDALESQHTHGPPELREAIRKSFREYYDCYVDTCNRYEHLNGKQMHDPFTDRRGKFEFNLLLERLHAIKESLPEAASDDSELSEEEDLQTPNGTV